MANIFFHNERKLSSIILKKSKIKKNNAYSITK